MFFHTQTLKILNKSFVELNIKISGIKYSMGEKWWH